MPACLCAFVSASFRPWAFICGCACACAHAWISALCVCVCVFVRAREGGHLGGVLGRRSEGVLMVSVHLGVGNVDARWGMGNV
eukprot:14859146-Alexandrium_andersonii.AAC.1